MFGHSRSSRVSILIGAAALALSVVEDAHAYCEGDYDCVAMVIDSGDPVLIQMGEEMSNMVTNQDGGTFVKPTEGPIANIRKVLSRENAGLSVVPSDMLKYLDRMDIPVMRRARNYLRFIMTIGQKDVHVLARKEFRSLKDLDGKRVVVGPDNTALWVVSNNLLYLHGATPSERIQWKPGNGILALLFDRVDAVFVVGQAPLPLIQNLKNMRTDEELKDYVDQIQMLSIEVPETATEYRRVTLNYPGFAESVDSVAILPTLVSYDFSLKSTPYFLRRCRELGEIGRTVRGRLEELRRTGHKQWQATSWELEAGEWEKDPCFFGTAKTLAVVKPTVTGRGQTQSIGAALEREQ